MIWRTAIVVADLYMEESEGNDDLRAEYLCPYCAEDYDVVSLCCHIDEHHPIQAKNGRKRRVRKGGSCSTLSMLRRELRDGALQSLLGGSSFIASSNSDPDPLLSSFMFSPLVADESLSATLPASIQGALVKENSKDHFLERKPKQLQLSEEDKVENARRFEFVQGLLLSTILDDKL
ncbi:hypothetical protein LR48_Vigan635s010500 [Vigna angularis]|uniref:Protein dehydration-induced 19 C-terminal domain-containing protein n=1 Tax=Phaseolus angularis TaxID=3914 RepID=A0A0L9TEX4_PHAAN|nr:hypothetical protein LR48_Vigan635s010500 [Vigna angularis]